MKKNILIYGPELEVKNASYGGGTGGYTRNMKTYLDSFESNVFKLTPGFHTVRKKGNALYDTFAIRFLRDTYRLLNYLRKDSPLIVHILAQYRGATPREFMVCFICMMLRKPYIYEIKAGQFDHWYITSNFFNKIMMRFIMKNSSSILCEGERYIEFVIKNFNRKSIYWPNFVPSSEIKSAKIFQIKDYSKTPLNIVFIGYCYEGKGVFHLVNALNDNRLGGIDINLNLVGEESPEFIDFIESKKLNTNFKLIRHGKKNHTDVLHILGGSDVFCLPSKHVGEGHNNSVNEAIMLGIPIISTKNGFLGDVLKDGRCTFIDDLDHIANSFFKFIENPEKVRKGIIKSKIFFDENLHSDVVNPKLENIYKDVIR